MHFLRAAAVFVFAAALAGCGGGAAIYADKRPAAPKSVIEEIQERGALRVGMSVFAPWAMRDKNGEFIGFEVDVARALAEDLGVALELIPTAWDGIVAALLAGEFDVIIGGLSITPQRNLKINFSRPYARSGLDIAAGRELAAGFAALADFNRAGVVVAMRRGVAGAEAVAKLLPQAELRFFDDEESARREVINGGAHAWISAAPAPAFAAYENPDKLFSPLADTFEQSAEGFGLRKGDIDALNFFNNWILTRTESGWLKARRDYWFKTREWAARRGDES